MDINVSTSMGFENQNFLKNAAQSILQKNGVNPEKAEDIVNTAIFETMTHTNTSDISFISTAAQIALNNSLRETLNYLKTRANKKKYVLGEIWEEFVLNQNENDAESYCGELYDYEIDENLENIFAA